jgi:hypothetical protein
LNSFSSSKPHEEFPGQHQSGHGASSELTALHNNLSLATQSYESATSMADSAVIFQGPPGVRAKFYDRPATSDTVARLQNQLSSKIEQIKPTQTTAQYNWNETVLYLKQLTANRQTLKKQLETGEKQLQKANEEEAVGRAAKEERNARANRQLACQRDLEGLAKTQQDLVDYIQRLGIPSLEETVAASVIQQVVKRYADILGDEIFGRNPNAS